MENRTPVTPAPQHTLPRILGDFAQGDVARFHMPGHKGRGLGRFLPPEAARCDVTELSMTDNLHAPEGCIADTQLAVARAYGARASFLLVNGSTAALQAMLLSLEPDDRLLLYRDCHRSAISAAALAGVETVLETPGFDETAGLFAMPDADALSAALARTGATAVLITSPNAYGYCADLPALSAAAHAHGALLLVDAAHGAHFPFCDALPPGAAGFADLWGHSQHKTLNALTQAATLHLGDCRIPPERVQRALSLLQTTSPSYLLMASIDWSVFMAARDDWRAHIRRCEALRREIGAIAGLSAAPAPLRGAVACDPTRLVVDVSARNITGFAAMQALEHSGIFVEMADLTRLVLITSPVDDPAWYPRLTEALAALPYGRAGAAPAAQAAPPAPAARRMPIREASLARAAWVPLSRAAGRIAGETVGLYPPGVALCAPGEEISQAQVDALLGAQRAGASLFGVRAGRVCVVDAPQTAKREGANGGS